MATTISNTSVNFNNSTQQSTAYLGINGVIFTSNGTFTAPTGIKRMKITAIGGGGGASGANTVNPSYSTGGGGGGTSIKWFTTSAEGAVLTITVGQGGNGSTSATGPGQSGTPSIVTYLVAQYAYGGPGGGGAYGSGATPGQGGTSFQGDINISGTPGSNGGSSAAGGGSFLAPSLNPSSVAVDGFLYGGGAPRRTGTSSGNGGAGANGIVIIEY